MTDQELVQRVAEKVMGWQVSQSTGLVYDNAGSVRNQNWRPLDDWNHTMAVVEAMRTKGFAFVMSDDTEIAFTRFSKADSVHAAEAGCDQRAVLLAALKAIEATT